MRGTVECEDVMSRSQCIAEWTRLFGHPPPKYSSLKFIRQVLAYEAQVKTHGGHSRSVKQVLNRSTVSDARICTSANTDRCGDKPSAISLRAGTHLVREWNGRSYQVEVLESGFQMDGKTYRSLSAIARKITGAHWSGPRFFGLAAS